MKMRLLTITAIFLVFSAIAQEVKPVWKTDFSKTEKKDGKKYPKGWESKGTESGLKESVYTVVKDKDGSLILNMKSAKGRGGIIRDIKGVDLNKDPIMRWKWQVIDYPEGGDGRYDDKGDQAVSIYVISGSLMSQRAVMYTWETETPKNSSKSFSVFLGAFKAKWFSLRNKSDGVKKWYIEQRNVAEDFKKTYGFIPKKVAIMIFCKSDKTKTKSEANLAWIEFLPKMVKEKKKK